MEHSHIWKINKFDIILTAVLAAVSILLFVFLLFMRGNEPGRTALITVNGSVYGEYDLNINREILVETELGSNHVRIENGEVRVIDADCPDKYCVSDGSASRKGDTIVCLPHRMVVEIRSEEPEEDEIDAIVK